MDRETEIGSFGPAGLLQEIELTYDQAHPHASEATLTLVGDQGVMQVVLTAEALAELEAFVLSVRRTFPEVLDLGRDAPAKDG